ncbi:protein LURP-one-related 15 isoform X2 [Raphanus sativus]|uniref:Protein LURP-one-related 15 isoform X2 n=1 Tax=Raphanus sativus TaxID=3726 RepID=A0A9W3CUG3_RAPSA|nr:protein LURP-one-related 15 isoform X2 [Raphanus sativus]
MNKPPCHIESDGHWKQDNTGKTNLEVRTCGNYIHQKKEKEREREREEMVGVIVDPSFCVRDRVELAIVRDNLASVYGNYVITDVNGNLLFQVKKPGFGFHKQMILLDGFGSPVVTMREKKLSWLEKWKVFRGGSTEESDLLYTLKRSSIFQIPTKLDVFSGLNNEEKTCDFKVIGETGNDRSCVAYAGEYDAIVAKHKKHTWRSAFSFSAKDNFLVTVNENVDYAFIASLVVLFDVMDRKLEQPVKAGGDWFESALSGMSFFR